jgi:hypothetical protein
MGKGWILTVGGKGGAGGREKSRGWLKGRPGSFELILEGEHRC